MCCCCYLTSIKIIINLISDTSTSTSSVIGPVRNQAMNKAQRHHPIDKHAKKPVSSHRSQLSNRLQSNATQTTSTKQRSKPAHNARQFHNMTG